MKTKTEVFIALNAGKILISSATEIKYKLIANQLHYQVKNSNTWLKSDLKFKFSPSWKNLEVYIKQEEIKKGEVLNSWNVESVEIRILNLEI